MLLSYPLTPMIEVWKHLCLLKSKETSCVDHSQTYPLPPSPPQQRGEVNKKTFFSSNPNFPPNRYLNNNKVVDDVLVNITATIIQQKNIRNKNINSYVFKRSFNTDLPKHKTLKLAKTNKKLRLS